MGPLWSRRRTLPWDYALGAHLCPHLSPTARSISAGVPSARSGSRGRSQTPGSLGKQGRGTCVLVWARHRSQLGTAHVCPQQTWASAGQGGRKMDTGHTVGGAGHGYVFSVSLLLSYSTPHPQTEIIEPPESKLNLSPLCQTHLRSFPCS